MSFDLGLIDSGCGGIAVLRSLARQQYRGSILCLADTAEHPYGNKSPQQLERLLTAKQSFMWQQGCRQVLLACHTASSVMQAGQCGLQPALEQCLQQASNKRTLIIGTHAFINSGAYGLPARGYHLLACPALVQWVEHGRPQADQEIQNILQISPEVLILACTHYSWCYSYLCERLPQTCIVDPVAQLCLPEGSQASTTATIITSGCSASLQERLQQLWPDCPFEICQQQSLILR